jgi:hypothetical protein
MNSSGQKTKNKNKGWILTERDNIVELPLSGEAADVLVENVSLCGLGPRLQILPRNGLLFYFILLWIPIRMDPL